MIESQITIDYDEFCGVLTKVAIFVKELRQLLISFRPHDYKIHGYMTIMTLWNSPEKCKICTL